MTEHKLITLPMTTWKEPGQRYPGRQVKRRGKLTKKAKHSDAIMTGILVTRFKMGLIGVEDLVLMAKDTSRAERCSAAKKVLEAVGDLPDLPRRPDDISISDSLF
jgi:hypothetical protein